MPKDQKKDSRPKPRSQSNNQFKNLSIADVIEARDVFHVHLMHKANVVATAVGRYLIRDSDMKDGFYQPDKSFPRKPRRLDNSRVYDFSWSCVLVFVDEWQDESSLIHQEADNLIPKSIYMPDGRIVPICIVEAAKAAAGADEDIDINNLAFPVNKIGGGFPAIIQTQGETRVATLGCLVSDGHTVYALSNKHVTGERADAVFTRRGAQRQIGKASGRFLGKRPFTEMYPGWSGSNVLVNNDVGLIEVDNIKDWKTEILEVGEIGRLFDLSTQNLSLDLIGQKSNRTRSDFGKNGRRDFRVVFPLSFNRRQRICFGLSNWRSRRKRLEYASGRQRNALDGRRNLRNQRCRRQENQNQRISSDSPSLGTV